MPASLRLAIMSLVIALSGEWAWAVDCEAPVTHTGRMQVLPPLPRAFAPFDVVVYNPRPAHPRAGPFFRLTDEASGRTVQVSATPSSTSPGLHAGPLAPGWYRVEYFDLPHAPGLADRATLAMRFAVSSTGPMRVVEYVSAVQQQYFYTGFPAEMAALDAGAIPGWRRTGHTFLAFSPDEVPSTGYPVCRFLRSGDHGALHFFADPTECAERLDPMRADWRLETTAFGVLAPAIASKDGHMECQAVLYRLRRPGPDATHRLTTSKSIRDALLGEGWIDDATAFPPHDDPYAMCVLPDSD